MTNEEKIKRAKGIICKNCKWNECDNNACPTLQETIEAIELGLAEGRKEKWHDLRENPNDLPPKVKGCNFSTYVFSDNGNFVYYDYENKTFATNMITPIKIIAWCELPKFKE